MNLPTINQKKDLEETLVAADTVYVKLLKQDKQINEEMENRVIELQNLQQKINEDELVNLSNK